jgi:hypothetical protein
MMYRDKPDTSMPASSQSPMADTYGSFLNRMGEEVESVEEASKSSMPKPKFYSDTMKKATKFKDSDVSRMMRDEKARKAAMKKEEVEQVDEDKEKELAALAPPKDKVTKKDILVGRGVLKKHPTDPNKHVLAKEDAVIEAAKAKLAERLGVN